MRRAFLFSCQSGRGSARLRHDLGKLRHMALETAAGNAAPMEIAAEKILVLDFGAQYAQLIARRVREQNVYCEIVRHDITPQRIREIAPKGIILSGGPASVYDAGAPHCDPGIFRLGIPVLGICYGLQLACKALGGKVESSGPRIRPRHLPHYSRR